MTSRLTRLKRRIGRALDHLAERCAELAVGAAGPAFQRRVVPIPLLPPRKFPRGRRDPLS